MDKDTKKDDKNEPYSDKNKIKFKIFLSSGGEFEITEILRKVFNQFLMNLKRLKT